MSVGTKHPRLFGLVILLVLAIAVAVATRGMGLKSRVMRLFIAGYGLTKPVIFFEPQPVDGEHDVECGASMSLSVVLRFATLDPATLGTAKVTLAPVKGGDPIGVTSKQVGSRMLMVRPATRFQPGTEYQWVVDGMKTKTGIPIPFKANFYTGRIPDPAIAFHKVALPVTSGYGFTAVCMGLGHKLYAGTDEGIIFRYPVLADGTLGPAEEIRSLQKANGRSRLLIGFCFDPKATEENPILWVDHGYYSFIDSPDFSGKLTRMSGPNLETVEDVLVNLPRSYRDHVNNQPAFGPDGALYFPQGASNDAGAPDPIWNYRPEHLLTASILRVDVTKITPGQPLDVKTVDAGGTYDPRTPGAPVTVYATGIRNAYDLVWTTNGQLYVPTNGGSAGGNTPAGNGAPALTNLPEPENDWLFHVFPGGYYGHPNPLWNHYVMNGGNVTGGHGFAEIAQYPLGTKPDPQWQPACYDFGPHVSANGVIEYLSNTFSGKLKHDLIVCRYNAGSDLIDLHLDDKGNVAYTQTGIPGFTNLSAPLDVTEDTTNGNIYVSEYGSKCITLLQVGPGSSDQADEPVHNQPAPGYEGNNH
jgi:glucose/arabinose dehydrogenase